MRRDRALASSEGSVASVRRILEVKSGVTRGSQTETTAAWEREMNVSVSIEGAKRSAEWEAGVEV